VTIAMKAAKKSDAVTFARRASVDNLRVACQP